MKKSLTIYAALILFSFVLGACQPAQPGDSRRNGSRTGSHGSCGHGCSGVHSVRRRSLPENAVQAAERVRQDLDFLAHELAQRWDSAEKPSQSGLYSDLGLSNLGNTCYANAANKLIWAVHLGGNAQGMNWSGLRFNQGHLMSSRKDENGNDVFDLLIAKQPKSSQGHEEHLRNLFESFEDYGEKGTGGRRFLGDHGKTSFEQHDSAEYLGRILDVIGPTWARQFGFFREGKKIIFDDGWKSSHSDGSTQFKRTDSESHGIYFSLHINGATESLQDAIAASREGERLVGSNQAVKDDGHSMGDATLHRYLILDEKTGKLPSKLVFSLKRFGFNGATGKAEKIVRPIEVPQKLEFSYSPSEHEIAREQEKSYLLRLRAAVVHTGTTEGGHYYAYVAQNENQDSKNLVWFKHNDSVVSRVKTNEVFEDLKTQGYYFLYERSPLGEAGSHAPVQPSVTGLSELLRSQKWVVGSSGAGTPGSFQAPGGFETFQDVLNPPRSARGWELGLSQFDDELVTATSGRSVHYDPVRHLFGEMHAFGHVMGETRSNQKKLGFIFLHGLFNYYFDHFTGFNPVVPRRAGSAYTNRKMVVNDRDFETFCRKRFGAAVVRAIRQGTLSQDALWDCTQEFLDQIPSHQRSGFDNDQINLWYEAAVSEFRKNPLLEFLGAHFQEQKVRLEKLQARAQRGVPAVRIYEEVKRCDQQQEMLFRWIERVANHLKTELFERLKQEQSLNPQDSQFIQNLSRLVPTEFRQKSALLEVLKTEDISGE